MAKLTLSAATLAVATSVVMTGMSGQAHAENVRSLAPVHVATLWGMVLRQADGYFHSTNCVEIVDAAGTGGPFNCEVKFKVTVGALSCAEVGNPTTQGLADYRNETANVTVSGTQIQGYTANETGHMRGTIVDLNPAAPFRAFTIDIAFADVCDSEVRRKTFTGVVNAF
jgi:hypothetical protein